MAILRDEVGNPIPQYQTSTPNVFEVAKGANGGINANIDGTDATGVVQPAGGAGTRGWVSGIYDRLSKVILAAGTAIIGKVGIDQTAGQNVVSFGATAQPVTINGSLPNQTLVEQKTQANSIGGVLTFSANIGAIEIYNTDTVNAGVFTVNGLAINVPATKVFNSAIGGTPGATVTITGATTYIVSRYL